MTSPAMPPPSGLARSTSLPNRVRVPVGKFSKSPLQPILRVLKGPHSNSPLQPSAAPPPPSLLATSRLAASARQPRNTVPETPPQKAQMRWLDANCGPPTIASDAGGEHKENIVADKENIASPDTTTPAKKMPAQRPTGLGQPTPARFVANGPLVEVSIDDDEPDVLDTPTEKAESPEAAWARGGVDVCEPLAPSPPAEKTVDPIHSAIYSEIFAEETKGVDSPAYSEIYSEIFAEDADEAPGDSVPAAASDAPVKDTAPIATRTRSHSLRHAAAKSLINDAASALSGVIGGARRRCRRASAPAMGAAFSPLDRATSVPTGASSVSGGAVTDRAASLPCGTSAEAQLAALGERVGRYASQLEAVTAALAERDRQLDEARGELASFRAGTKTPPAPTTPRTSQLRRITARGLPRSPPIFQRVLTFRQRVITFRVRRHKGKANSRRAVQAAAEARASW